MRKLVAIVIALSVLAVAGSLVVVILPLRPRIVAVKPVEIAQIQANLAQITANSAQISENLTKMTGNLADASLTIKSLAAKVSHSSDGLLAHADKTLGKLDDTADILNTQLEKVGTDTDKAVSAIQDTSVSIKSVANDAHGLIDDNYYELSAAIQSFDVGMTSVARMSDNWAQAMPQLTEATKQIAKGVGKAGDALGIEADAITKPKRWYQKAWGPIYTIGRLLAAFL